MSDEEAPPESPPSDRDSVAPKEAGAGGRRRRLEGVIPEIVRRAVELGVEKAVEAPDNLKSFVGDLKVPKEIAHYLFTQIDDTKTGLFRVVAKEIRDFLEHTNFGGELQKVLTTVQFEVNTTIRFTPNDAPKNPPKKDRDDEEGEDVDGDEGEDEDDSGPTTEGRSSSTPLPKPEVKTAVHVRRDGRSRRREHDT
jgi:hypothetical protein